MSFNSNDKLRWDPITFFKKNNLNPRETQIEVLDKIKNNWENYKYFAISAPTGVGKTYIATSLADCVNRAYILTSTLQLQTQYENSWPDLVNLKGRGNYSCNLNPNFTVDAAPCSVNNQLISDCKRNKICSYYNQRNAALASQSMITNPMYMLYSTHCGFASDEDDPWVKRTVLIIDEAHTLESNLIRFAESTIDPEQLQNDFGVDLSGFIFSGKNEEDYFKIIEIRDILLDRATELVKRLNEEFPRVNGNSHDWAKGITAKVAERVKKMKNKIYLLDKAIQPLNIFFNTHSTPEELIKNWLITKIDDKNIIKLSPLYGGFLFHEYFGGLADKFIFLSATLGNKNAFCQELKIPDEECLFVEMDSPFKPENSPVIVMPSIKLSKDVYDKNVLFVGDIIDEILGFHPNQRGLIHSVTYDLQKHIFNKVSDANKKRLLCRDMDILNFSDKYPRKYKNEELLEIHKTTGKSFNSVLLSPSMMEGIDLYDDLSEFQIIIKLPWANLGDPRINYKSKMDEFWYANQMWINILQASGRSTRHENDSAITYILDKNFIYFWNQWKRNLPNWFNKRLVF